MNKTKQVLVAVMAITALGLSACNQPSNMGGVAVLNLAAVAKAIGEDVRINTVVQEFVATEDARLKALQSDLRVEIQAAQAMITDASENAAKQKVLRMAEQAQQTMRQELGKTEVAAKKLRIEQSNVFRTKIEPTTTSVAQSRGLGIVMIRNSSMISVDRSVEITDEVISKLKASQGEVLSDVTPAAPEADVEVVPGDGDE